MSNTLIYDGKKDFMEILLHPDAGEQEKYAADELRRYLELISGIPFDVVTAKGKRNVFAIGRACQLFIQTEKDLGHDGFCLKSVGDNLCIYGGKRGVIYAVYEFLERIGCRFFTHDCEKIPTYDMLALPRFDEKQVPVLEYRAHNYWMYNEHTRFAVKSRLNALANIREKHGGHIEYVWFVHSFETLLPPEIYAKEHPEYYALVRGKRPTKSGRFQLCLTNPDVLQVSIDRVREALRANPEKTIISISQNDWKGNCQCSSCAALDKKEGSPAGAMIYFVNAIAEALEEEFPEVVFDTLAYMYTRQVPKYARPRHNVCVRLCSIEACFLHSFESCDDYRRAMVMPNGDKKMFIDDLRDWGKVCGRMYIWDYTTCFAHYPTPHPNWRVLQPNMQAFVRNNVKGVFEQACGASKGSVDLNELRAYIISKLLWNADTDVDRHIKEFTDYYYGDAGVYIRQYINLLCDNAEKANCHVGFNDNPTHSFLNKDKLDEYEAVFDKAEAAVQGDALRLFRVAKARLALRYVRMKRKAMYKKIYDRDEINKFFSDWVGFGLTRIDEWVRWETTHKALLRDKWRGIELYEHWSDEGPAEY